MELHFHSPLPTPSSPHSLCTTFSTFRFDSIPKYEIELWKTMHTLVLFLVSILSATFTISLSDKFPITDVEQWKTLRVGSSIWFPVKGNVYPEGGWNLQAFYDGTQNWEFRAGFCAGYCTGSDVTWVQCDDKCSGCTLLPDQRYRRHNNEVSSKDRLCTVLYSRAKRPNDKCLYDVEYADGGYSRGVLVKDVVPIACRGKQISPSLGFGCGYDQKNGGLPPPPSTGGVLGLSSSKATIVSQLSDLGYVSNVVGHCLCDGGGYLFFGEDFVPSSMSWTPILGNSEGKYSSGPAEFYFGGRATGIRPLTLTFDSGSTYTYFNSQVYGKVENLLKKNLEGQPLKLVHDATLELCCKGPFKSVADVRNYFKPLAFIFKNSNNVEFQIPPEAYLIISKSKNVCLGILDGSKEGARDVNLIGDISMLNKMVVYDNQNKRIGWAAKNCTITPNNDQAVLGEQ